MRPHSVEKPFKCPVCPSSFHEHDEGGHLKVPHETSQCRQSPSAFRQSGELQRRISVSLKLQSAMAFKRTHENSQWVEIIQLYSVSLKLQSV